MTEHSPAEHTPLRVIRNRRSVRAYRPEPVPEATIRELLHAAVQAPTAMHFEPWGFVVVQEKARLKRYSDRAKSMLLRAGSDIAVGWGSAGGKRKAVERDSATLLADPAFNIFYDAGTLIVVCRKKAGAFADADCWLAAQNLMLEATARELGTCCIGFAVPVLNTTDVKRELGISTEGAAVAPIIVGFPRGRTASVSRNAPEILRWLK